MSGKFSEVDAIIDKLNQVSQTSPIGPLVMGLLSMRVKRKLCGLDPGSNNT